MEKKDVVIIALCIALILSLVGLISTSSRLVRISAEKNQFVEKFSETERLTSELTKNLQDLKGMLGKAEKEKEALARETAKMKEEMKKRLLDIAGEKSEAGLMAQ